MRLSADIYAKQEQVCCDIGKLHLIIPLYAAKEAILELQTAVETVERNLKRKETENE